MKERSFWILLDLIQPYTMATKKRERGKTPNSDIDLEARLYVALQWFAYGELIDVMQTYGVKYNEIYISVESS